MADWNERIETFSANETNKTSYAGVSNDKARSLLLNGVWEMTLKEAIESFYMTPAIMELADQKVKLLKRNGSPKK
jgi:hypothetical protein